MAPITLDGGDKVYGDGTVAVRDVDLEITDGEFICTARSASRRLSGVIAFHIGVVDVKEVHLL